MVAHKFPTPEWPDRIRSLIEQLNLTQAGLAERIGVSPATVSRWIQGKIEPTAEGYVALGNLAPRTEASYFWARAGLDISNLPDSSRNRAVSSVRASEHDYAFAANRKASHLSGEQDGTVAIPLFNVSAYGDRLPPRESVSLIDAEVEDVLLAPVTWCGSPEHMIGLHLHGDSMAPVIAPESIVFVDTAQTDRDQLNGKIVLASHRDLGFKVARFQRLAGTDLLISANQRYMPIDGSHASKWKVFGHVLWWVSRDADQKVDA